MRRIRSPFSRGAFRFLSSFQMKLTERQIAFLAPARQRTRIAGRNVHSGDEASRLLAKLLDSKRPVLISRLGTTETKCLKLLGASSGSRDTPERLSVALSTLSGVYPASHENATRFASLYSTWIGEIDVLGVRDLPLERVFWQGETRAIKRYFRGSHLISIEDLVPFHHVSPWTWALADSKVMVVHPFAETIAAQSTKITEIFPNGHVPKFDVEVFRPPQLLADSQDRVLFESWFDAFESAREQLLRELSRTLPDFVLIGAGALGLGLGLAAKQAGYRVIHVGGALQLFFGIMGSRWEKDGTALSAIPVNEFWVRPAASEKPAGASNVEDGCYW